MTPAGAFRTFVARVWACRETAFLVCLGYGSCSRRYGMCVSSGGFCRVRARRVSRAFGVGDMGAGVDMDMGGSVADRR